MYSTVFKVALIRLLKIHLKRVTSFADPSVSFTAGSGLCCMAAVRHVTYEVNTPTPFRASMPDKFAFVDCLVVISSRLFIYLI